MQYGNGRTHRSPIRNKIKHRIKHVHEDIIMQLYYYTQDHKQQVKYNKPCIQIWLYELNISKLFS